MTYQNETARSKALAIFFHLMLSGVMVKLMVNILLGVKFLLEVSLKCPRVQTFKNIKCLGM